MEGVKPFKAPAGQNILHPGEAMGPFHIPHQRQIGLRPHRQRHMPAFRGRHQSPARRGMDRGCVEPGADADHQPRGVGRVIDRPFDHGAQKGGVKRVESVALRLKVVQHRHARGPGRLRHARAVDAPVEVGHMRDAIIHRTGDGDAGALDGRRTCLGQIAGQNLAQPGMVGIGEAADGGAVDLGPLGQRHAGVGSADIRDKGRHGWACILGHPSFSTLDSA